MLAFVDEFRTFDWERAVGDLETTTKQIKHLLSHCVMFRKYRQYRHLGKRKSAVLEGPAPD
jgi:hypothetical protein